MSRLDEIQAAILRVKLKSLNDSNTSRRKIARKYLAEITNPKVILPKEHFLAYHVYHLFVIKVSNRSDFKAKLNKSGIFPGIHYALPVHRHPSFNKLFSQNYQQLETTDNISSQILSLPIYPELSLEDVDRIILEINQI